MSAQNISGGGREEKLKTETLKAEMENPSLPHCEDIEFGAYDLEEREWSVVMTVLQLSLFVGRDWAPVPQQSYFTEMTGISKGNISTILGRLRRNNVLLHDETHGRYQVMPTRMWKVPRRVRWTPALKDRLEWLRQLNPDSTVREPELPEFPREPEGLASVVSAGALPRLAITPAQEGPVSGAGRANSQEVGDFAAPTLGASAVESEEDSLTKQFTARMAHMRRPGSDQGSTESRPTEVPTVGTVCAEPRAGKSQSSHGGNSMVPTVGTSVPVQSQLTVHGFTALKQLSSEQLLFNARAGTRESERELMMVIERFVGREDMLDWGGNWLVHWIRKYPHETIRRALLDIHCQVREGRRPNVTMGAWIKDTVRRFA